MARERRYRLYPGERDPVITLVFVTTYFIFTVLMLVMLVSSYLRLS